MAINLSSIASVSTTVPALGNLVLVTPYVKHPYRSMQNSQKDTLLDSLLTTEDLPLLGNTNKEGFLFDFEAENTVALESDITDHYVEDNSAVQVSIAKRPVTVTVSGFVGELNDIIPAYLQPARFLADKLTVISGMTPSLSVTALRVFNTARQLAQAVSIAERVARNAWQQVKGQEVQNKQQQAFSWFSSRWHNRDLFQITTPWTQYENMAIQSIRAVQDESTQSMSTFEITFKQINKVESKTITSEEFQARLVAQGANIENNGTTTGVDSISISEIFA